MGRGGCRRRMGGCVGFEGGGRDVEAGCKWKAAGSLRFAMTERWAWCMGQVERYYGNVVHLMICPQRFKSSQFVSIQYIQTLQLLSFLSFWPTMSYRTSPLASSR
jgi:serine protease inhibitor ecotin